MIVTKEGTLLAFCEGRRNNSRDHGDIDLMLKRSTDNGENWSEQMVVHSEGGRAEITIGNPCPVVDQDTGIIWLPLCRDNRDVLITKSVDDGVTWSEPVDITHDVKLPDWGWYATGPGVGIQLRHGQYKGRLVIPCDHRGDFEGEPTSYSHIFYSDDHGETWKLGGTVSPYNNECQVVELTDGTLMINMRSNLGSRGNKPEKGNMRTIAWSKDGGETWSDIQFDEKLIEPVCQASLIRYNGELLFSNPASKKPRVNMTVRLSYDDGKTWPVDQSLYAGPTAYSCLTVLPDMTIGCLYERGDRSPYEKITFARFAFEWLTHGREE